MASTATKQDINIIQQVFQPYDSDRLIREFDLELPVNNVFAREARGEQGIAAFVEIALNEFIQAVGYPVSDENLDQAIKILAYLAAELRRRTRGTHKGRAHERRPAIPAPA